MDFYSHIEYTFFIIRTFKNVVYKLFLDLLDLFVIGPVELVGFAELAGFIDFIALVDFAVSDESVAVSVEFNIVFGKE